MSSRSVTYFVDDDKTIVGMYCHGDALPNHYGKSLGKFLRKFKLVNGLGMDNHNIANGIGCLAAQTIAHFKKGAGKYYIVSKDYVDRDLEYHVYSPDEKEIWVRVRNSDEEELFVGNISDFVKWCRKFTP